MAQATLQIEGAVQSVPLNQKVFKTGSRGFHGHGKMATSSGKKFQVNIIVVEIGSKKS